MINKIYTIDQRKEIWDELSLKQNVFKARIKPNSENDYIQEEAGMYVMYRFYLYKSPGWGCHIIVVGRFVINPEDFCSDYVLFIGYDIGKCFFKDHVTKEEFEEGKEEWFKKEGYRLIKRRDATSIDTILSEIKNADNKKQFIFDYLTHMARIQKEDR